MIMMGDPRYIPDYIYGLIVYNYSSPIENMPRLSLMPPQQYIFNNELDFDMWYANWLLTDPAAFHDLMMVVYAIYSGYDVYLCASYLDIFESINESFMKFLQQRYGLQCYVIKSKEDLECVRDTGSSFTIEGLANLDMDKDRISITAYESKQNNKEDHLYDFVLSGTENTEYGNKQFMEQG